MRALPYAVLSVLALGAALPLARAQSVSISADITGEVVPGVYGHVVIGNGAPPPPVVYAQPVVAVPATVVVGAPVLEPIYLHVPPGHARNWRKHCHEYNACNRPVYFVRSAEYEPGYRPDHDHDHDHGHGHGHDRDHGHDRGNHDD
ncbi:MAG TPA: hypothetical protein VKB72_12280 [Steroidobacteraceae bacterium]|nr:hypothetical protein [Steroidobacteraceae bacterium]